MFDNPSFDHHEGVHFFSDEESGLRAVIAIHSTTLGPSSGGTRMWDYPDSNAMLTDVLRLSQGMSYKNAMASIPHGGGKDGCHRVVRFLPDIGIEIVNGGHDFGLPDYPEAQIVAVLALSRTILSRHPIAACDVIGHSDLAPDRKQDPGEKFPWKCLAENGVGLWPDAAPAGFAPSAPGDDGEAVEALRQSLFEIGYGVARTGAYDDALKSVVLAFQRRFRPGRLSGNADEETCALIEGLRRKVTSVTSKR